MNAEEVTTHARKGAAWSLVIGAAALPVAYLQKILLGRVDGGGEVLGTFALLILFVNAVQAFFFPGGRNVFPTFFPKIQGDHDRARFVSGFFYLVLGGACAAIAVTVFWPASIELALGRKDFDPRLTGILQCLIPFALVSALANSVVMGNMSFVWGTVLHRTQLVCVTAVALLMFFTGSESMISDAVIWLAGAMTLAAIINTIVSCSILFRRMHVRLRPKFPSGCLKFSVVAYIDTIQVFLYSAVDKYFVLAVFSVGSLGVYVASLEIARIIPLAVQQLGHVLLATFSKLLKSDSEETLANGYRRIARLTCGVYASIAIVIIVFAHPALMLFGTRFAEEHHFLIALAVAMNIDSLRTVNTMTLMAYERMSSVFWSKFLQNGVQLALTFVLIGRYGIMGVIAAKGAGHAVNALVLVVTTARLRDVNRLRAPAVYYLSQILVTCGAWLAFSWDGRGILGSVLMVSGSWAILWFVGGYTVEELRAVVPWRRKSPGENA